MTFHTVECTCQPDQEHADGTFPSFYTDETKAAYMWKRQKEKASAGARNVQQGIVFPNLKDYNLYFAVHLNGLHILTVK